MAVEVHLVTTGPIWGRGENRLRIQLQVNNLAVPSNLLTYTG
jgi:hypothetical protein